MSSAWKPLLALLLVVACHGGPPRFAQSGPFSASGTCGADVGYTVASSPAGWRTNALGVASPESGYGYEFEGTSIVVTFEQGRLVRIQYENAAEPNLRADQRFDHVVVNAGRWQEVSVGRPGQLHVRVGFEVEGDQVQVRVEGGKAVRAECVWD